MEFGIFDLEFFKLGLLNHEGKTPLLIFVSEFVNTL